MYMIDFIWIAIWAAMYSGPVNLLSPAIFSSLFVLLNSIRAYFPFVAIIISTVNILKLKWRQVRSASSLFRSPINLLICYCLVGAVIGSIMSDRPLISLYYAGLYFAPLLVVWVYSKKEDSIFYFRRILNLTYIMIGFLVLLFLPEVIKIAVGIKAYTGLYDLPFNLGYITRNGAGRYAAIISIISIIRIENKRFIWLLPLFPSLYFLAQTESRTALFGFFVAICALSLFKGFRLRNIFFGAIAAYIFWLSAFLWRSKGSVDYLVGLTGRETIWYQAIDLIKQFPITGYGFYADRLMLDFAHVHNTIIHALLQTGILGAFFLVSAFITVWILVIRKGFIQRAYKIKGVDRLLVIESIALLTFLTMRSFFESTAAFYGIDLLVFVPIIAYLQSWDIKYSMKEENIK